MKWLKRILCDHNWYPIKEQFIDAGMGKMIVNKCAKCEKEKAEFV